MKKLKLLPIFTFVGVLLTTYSCVSDPEHLYGDKDGQGGTVSVLEAKKFFEENVVEFNHLTFNSAINEPVEATRKRGLRPLTRGWLPDLRLTPKWAEGISYNANGNSVVEVPVTTPLPTLVRSVHDRDGRILYGEEDVPVSRKIIMIRTHEPDHTYMFLATLIPDPNCVTAGFGKASDFVYYGGGKFSGFLMVSTMSGSFGFMTYYKDGTPSEEYYDVVPMTHEGKEGYAWGLSFKHYFSDARTRSYGYGSSGEEDPNCIHCFPGDPCISHRTNDIEGITVGGGGHRPPPAIDPGSTEIEKVTVITPPYTPPPPPENPYDPNFGNDNWDGNGNDSGNDKPGNKPPLGPGLGGSGGPGGSGTGWQNPGDESGDEKPITHMRVELSKPSPMWLSTKYTITVSGEPRNATDALVVTSIRAGDGFCTNSHVFEVTGYKLGTFPIEVEGHAISARGVKRDLDPVKMTVTYQMPTAADIESRYGKFMEDMWKQTRAKGTKTETYEYAAIFYLSSNHGDPVINVAEAWSDSYPYRAKTFKAHFWKVQYRGPIVGFFHTHPSWDKAPDGAFSSRPTGPSEDDLTTLGDYPGAPAFLYDYLPSTENKNDKGVWVPAIHKNNAAEKEFYEGKLVNYGGKQITIEKH